MRRSTLLLILIAAFASAPMAPAQKPARVKIPKSHKDLKYPPLNEIKPPEPVRFELANGMTVYLVEDHELPTIGVSAMIRAGSRWEPAAKTGLAEIAGSVMRTGGTSARSGDQLDDELDRLGAIVETSIGQDSGRAVVQVLKEDIDKGLEILADIIRNPAFPEDKIDLAKIAERDQIARRNEVPAQIASREFARAVLGKDSPYARITEYDTVNSITRDDLAAFHRQFFQPENVILGVYGDFQAVEMRAKVERVFGGWPRGGKPKPPIPAVDETPRTGVYSINKEDVNQSWITMGHVAGKRSDPDYYALSVANGVLRWRLFVNVRSEQGLAYAVGSNWNAGWDRPGLFTASGGTKSESTLKFLGSVKSEIEKMRQAEPSIEEFTRAKDSILKGFAFEFDSTQKIVERLMTYDYFGYPRDYLLQYRAGIEKVTPADLLRVAGKHFQPDRFAVLVVGKEKDFDQPLASIGKVTPVDITIPPPKQEALAAATPDAVAKGRKLLAAVRDAMGGATLQGVKDYSIHGDFTAITPNGEFALRIEVTTNLSGKTLNKMITPMGEMAQGYDGAAGWIRTPQGVRDIPAAQLGEFEAGRFRDTIHILQNIDNPAYTVQSMGQAEEQGKPAEVVAVSDPKRNLQVKLYIDPEANLLVKKVYSGAFMGAPGEVEEIYSDWREAGGLKMPHAVTLNQDGKKRGSQKVTELKVNPGVPEEAYKKPQ
jgi:zinc protease